MKKENDNLAIISDSEITLLNELVNTLIDLANEDAEKALQQMLYLVENRSFSKQKRLYADVMNKIGEFHGRNGRIEQATEVYNRMLEYVRQGKMKKMEFIALSNLSLCKAYSGKYLEAIETWKLLLIKNIDAEERFHLLNNISAAYGYIGENSLALKYAFAALHIAETHNLEEFKISPLINIGTAFERDLMHQKALDYWLVALDLAKRANSLQNTFNILSNISLAYNALGNKELALQYAFESLELRRKSAFQKEVAAPLNNIGYIYETNGDPDAALEYYEKALKVYRQSTDTMAMANCMANFGSIYQMKGDYETARKYLEEALETVALTDSQTVTIRVMNMLADVYTKQGDFEKGYLFMRQIREKEYDLNENLKKNSVSVNEANYYKQKIEIQADAYKQQNKELRKKNKIIQQAGKELQDKNAVLSHTVEVLNWLVSVISHDVRAPLGNFNRVLGMILDGSIPEEGHAEILANLKTSGENVYKMVNEMLDGIRLQRRKLDFNVDLVQQDLVPILMSIFAIYLPIAMQKRIDLTYEFASEKIEAIFDADLIKIVVRNILNNALKFTEERGSVNISVASEGDKVRLCVSDTGKGMDCKTLQALHAGLVLSSSDGDIKDGIGLGLSLCRNALNRMNATMEIESSPGKGSRVSILLPLKST